MKSCRYNYVLGELQVRKQVFRVKKLVGLPPQLELLADSVTTQVHNNLFKLAHTRVYASQSFTHTRAHKHEQAVQLFLSFLCSFGAAPNNPAIHT